MTELEKEEQRQLKETAIVNLNQVEMSKYVQMLDYTDARIGEYVRMCIKNPADHNVDELLGLLHFFGKCDRFDWNAKKVQKVLKFMELLPFNVEKPYNITLSPLQCFQFANIFGFLDSQGRRLTRTVYIFVPRKFGKTTMIAGLGIWDFLLGPADGEQYVGANSTSQAKILFNIVRGVMKRFDKTAKHFRTNRQEMYWLGDERRTSFTCLSSTAKTKDGLNANLAILDEYAQARDLPSAPGSMLKDTLTTSMGVRPEPLTVVITTASDVTEGAFAREYEGVRNVLAGKTENWRVFASLFHPDVDDDVADERTWHKVQPHLGYTVQPDFYRNEYAQAQLSADGMLAFLTKQLNVWTKSETVAFVPNLYVQRARVEREILNIPAMLQANTNWKKNGKVGNKPYKKLKCVMGIDLSVKDDLSAVAYVWGMNKKVYCYVEYFLPWDTIHKHKNTPLYEKWVEDGWLTPCGRTVIDDAEIFARINETAALFSVQAIGYDPRGMQEVNARVRAAGAGNLLKPVPQTGMNLGPAMLAIQTGMMKDPKPDILLCYNPITEWMFGNVTIVYDGGGNMRAMKATADSPNKIDGVAAICDALCVKG